MNKNDIILSVKNLTVSFPLPVYTAGRGKTAEKGLAVDDVSFNIYNNEILGIAGESGSGKSVIAYSIMRLLSIPPARIEKGEIIFAGKNILQMPESEFDKLRNKEISMIFQEPSSSLNPVMNIGEQISETITAHSNLKGKEISDLIVNLLKKTGISDPEYRIKQYPHQLSGGMLQRIVIAIAVANNPTLLIADEPTTSLDVTTQSQIIDILKDIKKSNINSSILFISHNLGLISSFCTKVIILYGGKIQESGNVKDVFTKSFHPYTKGLIESLPLAENEGKKFKVIKGNVPDIYNLPSGCKFSDRCPFAFQKCFESEPNLIKVADNHYSRCFLNE